MRRLLIVVAVLAAVAGTSSPAQAAARPDVVVVGVPGLTWADVDPTTTPTLWKLAGDSTVGSLSVKAADPVSCPDDGWLTLGAGNRARADDRSGKRCVASPLKVRSDGEGADVDGFAKAYLANARRDDDTHLGALADASSGCVSAAGATAALGAANRSGHVAVYREDVLAAVADPSFLRRCFVTLVAATPDDVDHVVRLVELNAPRDAVLLVVGVSEDQAAVAHLHVALAHGDGFPGGELVSPSTRRAPFVQLVDVAPTVLELRGAGAPTSVIGEPWRAEPGHARDLDTADHIDKLADLDRAAQHQRAAIVPFWVTLVALMIAASASVWVSARFFPSHKQKSGRRTLRRSLVLACAWSALLPASSFLAGVVSWWRAPAPVAVLMVATAVAAAGLAAFASWLEATVFGRGPFGLAASVGLITFGVIGLDLLTGAHLQIFTMAGYSPLVAGRFAGIGNVAFGVYAAGAVLAAAEPRRSLVVRP